MSQNNLQQLLAIKKILLLAQIIAKSLGRDIVQPQDIKLIRNLKNSQQKTGYEAHPQQYQITSYVSQQPKIFKIRDLLAQTSEQPQTTIEIYQISKKGQDQILPHLYQPPKKHQQLTTIQLSLDLFGQNQLQNLLLNNILDLSYSGHARRTCQDIQTRLFSKKYTLKAAINLYTIMLQNQVADSRFISDFIRDAVCQIYFTRKFNQELDLQLLGQLFGKSICLNPDPQDSSKRIGPILDDIRHNSQYALMGARFLSAIDVDYIIYSIFEMFKKGYVDKSWGIRDALRKCNWEKLEAYGVEDWQNFITVQETGTGSGKG
ncbi:hypothetical protein SS50377_26797 [Spironucleus salmonicida]|uniref:Uncharacterized protein n=1 Tax=Spironucleus salmonicida TaxID=348837 RepID=V6LZT6_9EUKA|nr:hypothetical protein SS50377_26797 [Spironucleus salmonicida]|eukprot:EST49266.1 Hypothetical protein SS50377_10487 [Spironucleus salmonicida]